MNKHTARETWLQAAIAAMSPWFARVNAKPIPEIRVSVGWAKRAGKNKIGWCWKQEVSADGVTEIQISPEKADPVKVLDILLHEMVHASDNCESQHRGYFRKTALALGLTGKMTATVPGEELEKTIRELALELGPYPHAALSPTARVGKQGTRMLKVVCPDDGYTLRTTKKWIDLGLPTCPCGEEMELAL